MLPSAVATKIAFTANARAIRHFLSTRGAIIGDEEMRTVSALLFDAVAAEAPSLVGDFRVDVLPDESRIVLHRGRGTG